MRSKTINVEYYALLKEERGLAKESLITGAKTASDLYQELCGRHPFSLRENFLRVAVNGKYVPWDRELSDGDTLIFIPPVSGG